MGILQGNNHRVGFGEAVPDGLGEILGEILDGVFTPIVDVEDIALVHEIVPRPLAPLASLVAGEGLHLLLEHVEQVNVAFEEEALGQLDLRVVVRIHSHIYMRTSKVTRFSIIMNSQAEHKLKDYVFKLIEAHAHNQTTILELQLLRERTERSQMDARAMQNRKDRLESISETVRKECNNLADNSGLQAHLNRKAHFQTATPDRLPRNANAPLPKITVADMAWALEYLTQLKEEGLREL